MNQMIRLFLILLLPYTQLINAQIETELRIAQPKTKENDTEMEMVFVQGGTFKMGCAAKKGNDCWVIEKPAHRVTLSSFYIGKYEVTQAQWRAVMGNNPSFFSGCDSCPVENISWNLVQQFIAQLNKQTNKLYRLPTEAEWEYAAGGGNKRRRYLFAGSNNIDDVSWYKDNSNSRTHRVGEKKPNKLGIYDMSGNVWEFCSDFYGPYSRNRQNNPQGLPTGRYRVLRGGSWLFRARNCRCYNRILIAPEHSDINSGFRLALVP